ncbi:MAG: hypothetical protein HOQ22_02675 [Nocardioidaceae bacterium]|nr:hypothetical protein [Nocardioidaceae bacterium]NUS49929.1 hypothetical protein [Nocardioidaceae bacterium]
MKKLSAVALSAATLALALNGGASLASGGSGSGGGSTSTSTSTGAWPAAYPLPTSPGTVTAQSSTRATVRSTDTVATVMDKLDALYAAKGCSAHVAVNKPAQYFCVNPATHKTDEIYFTFAALDPKPTDASRSQTNAFYVKG